MPEQHDARDFANAAHHRLEQTNFRQTIQVLKETTMKKFASSLLLTATLLFTTQAGELERSLTSAHYRITLIIGTIPKMLTPEQAKGATSSEVMVGNSMSMSANPKNANAHLEVAVADKASGKVITNLMPTIVVIDASGKATKLESLMTMYDVTSGPADTHFGQNMFLARGQHSVRVTVKGETVVFKNISR
jgi:hypothetical protein